MTASTTTTIKIINNKGLHARATAKFVKLAETFDAEILVEHEGRQANATSMMDLLLFAASKDTKLTVTATGRDADKAVQALVKLVNDKFNEEI